MSGNDILEKQLEAVKENSKTVRNIYISYLGFATYIWLTAESVTHLQLLTPKEGLSLPIIGVKLGVVGFFGMAPILLVLFHTYFSLHVWKLAELTQNVRMKTQGQVGDWQDQIPGSLFLWSFFKSSRQPWIISKLINSFVFLSFWCVVPIILLRCQWQFLPYHHSTINFLLQAILPLSLFFAFYFISRIDPSNLKVISEFQKIAEKMYPQKKMVLLSRYFIDLMVPLIKKRWFLIIISGIIVLFSWTVLIIPKDKEENEACFATYQKPFEGIVWALNTEGYQAKTKNENCLKIKDVINRNLILREKKTGDKTQ